MDAKLKHLEFLQAVISRMAGNSFLFKGWAITIAAVVSAFAAAQSKAAVLAVALVTTVMFWGLDAYYLRLERAFRCLYAETIKLNDTAIDFSMQIDATRAIWKWLSALLSPPLVIFYGAIAIADTIAIFIVNAK